MKSSFQGWDINGNSSGLHPIGHIDRQDGRNTKILNLSKEIEILLEVLYISHYHHYIRKINIIPIQETTYSYLFIHRIRIGTISTRQVIDTCIDDLGELTESHLFIHSNSRIIPYMLIHPRKQVEDGSFPYIGIAYESYFYFIFTHQKPY